MGRLCNVAEPHKILEYCPQTVVHAKSIRGDRDGPFVAITLAVNMEMRGRNLSPVWVAMRCTMYIEPNKHDYLPSSILKLALEQINASATEIKKELLPTIRRLERQDH